MTGTHERQPSAAERHEAAGGPARRAHAAAWSVFIVMAGTSMTFQTFHAITAGDMAWPLAVLEGVIPLALSIGILEVAAVWGNWKAQVVAYAIAIGAMYESASATGAVTGHAAPAHGELVFGLILDGAALFAIAFINHGPTAKQAVAAVARREAELLDAVRSERSARERQAAEHRSSADGLRAELGARQAAFDRALAEAGTALDAARSDAEAAIARAEVLAAKLAGAPRRSATGTGRRGTAPRTGSGTAPKDDLLEARARKLLAANPGMSGAELAGELTVSPGYGRKLRRRLTQADRPDGALQDRSEDRTGTA